MSIPPVLVASARMGWHWQWKQLMKGLAQADEKGNYKRPPSQHPQAILPPVEDLRNRSKVQIPLLIVGRSCPWAHRTWIVHKLRNLENSLTVHIASADHQAGRWKLEPPLLGCDSLLALYERCGSPPSHRATVPVLIDPGKDQKPLLLGNESAQLVEVLNEWPSTEKSLNLSPKELQDEIEKWQNLLQKSVNDGVYRCGFARNQAAYNLASNELFEALKIIDKSLEKKGPWLCGKNLTLADVRLFPTLIRWEYVYMPLFGCSKEPLWKFQNLWKWRQKFLKLPKILETCNSIAWREDYFGALFPLNPSGIIPSGADLTTMVNAKVPRLR